MRHAAECSFDYQPTMTRIKQWNEFYRKRHQERGHEIWENDRRNAIRTDDVNKVLHSRYVMRCLQDMQHESKGWTTLSGSTEKKFEIIFPINEQSSLRKNGCSEG
ncbi:unnamed protein product [Clavelina lepadiformis]|uniref:Uncharacterized protein n=1 Tax=Clavelina lepadiformis TaxID=159417 RepID=A0ABP0F3D0_CLALP